MATNRFGYSDDFVLKNGKVGINSSNPQEKLDVSGLTKAQDLRVTGVSTFTTYEGFLNSNQTVRENITLNENQGLTASLSGEIIVGTGVTITVATAGVGTTTVGVGTNQTATNTLSPTTTTQSGQGVVDSLKVYNTFNPPVGGTNDRPIKAKPGQLYYNQDFKTIEFWDGNNWRQVDYTTRSGRGIFVGGSPGSTNIIDYVNITTLGNAIDFGRLGSGTMTQGGACSSAIRGLYGGGENPAVTNSIEYFTLASGGDAIDFGDLSEARRRAQEHACSSSTRGIWSGGYNPGLSPASRDTIDYVEIATTGTALDFGNLIGNRESGASCSSTTRGIFAGGRNQPANLALNEIQLFTIAAKGNAIEFGELTAKRFATSSCSNSVRGIFAAGNYPVAPVARLKVIDYITIASNGNAIHFGDLSEAIEYPMATAGQTRGLIAGGANPSQSNAIQYITISSTGNAEDFGDLTYARSEASACSDSHGGLGGF